MRILYLAAEVSPYAKTGGLADVAGSLPPALLELGCDIRVVMPGYGFIRENTSLTCEFSLDFNGQRQPCKIRQTYLKTVDGKSTVFVYFIENTYLYSRDCIYGYHDDEERFAFFCVASLLMLPHLNFKPDIIHCNDWHTGPVCMLLKEKYKFHQFYSSISTVFSIHNLQYQGVFPKEVLTLFDMGYEVFTPEKVEFYGNFSFMKAGLVYCDKINTVSSEYALEIKTAEYGEKLDGLLRQRADDLYGILNGIDYIEFDPSNDKNLSQNYSSEELYLKKFNKTALQNESGLETSNCPLFAIVSRLTWQKGLDLVLHILPLILELDLQFIILGTGEKQYENEFTELAMRYPSKMKTVISFDPALAKKIYAGSDIFLMPSRFEPCGLGQLIGMRYGTVPVVRATGGLKETVTDLLENEDKGTGFLFNDLNPEALYVAISAALKIYYEDHEKWFSVVKRCMLQDFSWKMSASKYLDLYKKIVASKITAKGVLMIDE